MKQIIECVPNFSEALNKNTIDAIEKAIRNEKDVDLLNIDIGLSANRTVFTFIGRPQSVVNAAFSAIKIASELIDMRLHKGEHPRMGATDVCPLIPVSNIRMEEVVEYAQILSDKVGNELGIPVYSYEYNSTKEYRKRLEQIRKGEYEGLNNKLKLPDWKPDYGPSVFNSKSGATVIGARYFLIAYNINLDTKDVNIAKVIASNIRESGTVKIVNNNKMQIKGIFPNLKAIGWYMKDFDKVQVSTNITNYNTTPIYKVFETVKELVNDLGHKVTGSELVGLIPKDAIIDAGRYYSQCNNLTVSSDMEYIKIASKYLGLNDVKPFDEDKCILGI